MNFEGTYDVKAPRQEVWEFVIDPDRMGHCLPDLKRLDVLGEDKFNSVVRVGVGFIKGDFNFQLTILEKVPLIHATVRGHGTGSGSTIDIDASVDLSDLPDGTRLAYKADVKVGGAMAQVAQRFMTNVAEKTVENVFSCVKLALESRTQPK